MVQILETEVKNGKAWIVDPAFSWRTEGHLWEKPHLSVSNEEGSFPQDTSACYHPQKGDWILGRHRSQTPTLKGSCYNHRVTETEVKLRAIPRLPELDSLIISVQGSVGSVALFRSLPPLHLPSASQPASHLALSLAIAPALAETLQGPTVGLRLVFLHLGTSHPPALLSCLKGSLITSPAYYNLSKCPISPVW